MLRLIKNSLFCLLLVLATPSAFAFSLLGPYAAWQDELKMYIPGTIGGPMNLGEEYRWNLRTVYYAYDESFLNYFGSNGVAAIEAAIKILNDLPAVTNMSANLSEYPLNTTRVNYRAAALNLLDLKSTALTFLLEEMGLTSAENFVWTLRDHRHLPGDVLQFLVIKRNFDPVTWEPSSFVNGTLYTYSIFHSPDPHLADAVESPVDPLAIPYTSVASLISSLSPGSYYTGLTRDDAGGLRYLLRSSNLNVENVVSNGVSGPSNGSGFGGTNNFPWWPIGVTNQFGTNATNFATNATNFVATALRPGIEKLTFVRVQYDSILGQNLTPITNTWTETIYTNRLTGLPTQQRLERAVTAPDFLFSAEDLGLGTGGYPVILRRTDTTGWADFDGLNGQAALDGPGIIQPSIVISFSKLGPSFVNQSPNFLSEASPAFIEFIWGSYDGTTNAPIVYPSGTSIKSLESMVLGR